MFKKLFKVLSLTAMSSLFVSPFVLNNVTKVEDDFVNSQVKKASTDSTFYFEGFDSPNWCTSTETATSKGYDIEIEVDGDHSDLNGSSEDTEFYYVHFTNFEIGTTYKLDFITHKSSVSGCLSGYLLSTSVYDMTPNYSLLLTTFNNAGIKGIDGYKFQPQNEGYDDSDSFVFTAPSTDFDFVFQAEDINIGDIYKMSINVSVSANDTTAPDITASKYALSLPVGTSTRITKDYLLKQKIFSVIDETDGDITDRLVIESNNINYNTTGTYKVVCSWTDDGGNKATCTLNVVVGDFTKPTYSISNSTIYVEAPNTISNDDLLANVSFIDNYSSVTKSIVSNSYNQTTNLGTYQVSVRGTDTSGNYSTATFNVVVRDTIAPELHLTNQDSNEVVSGSYVCNGMFGIVENGSGIKTATLDGKSVSVSSNKTYSLPTGSSLSDGEHIFVVTDNANNSSSFTFYIDRTAPVISFTDNNLGSVESGAYVSGGTFNISESGSGIKSAILDGTLVTLSNNSFSLSSGLNEGSHTFVVKDNVGNSSSFVFTLDNNAPEVSGIVEGSVYKTASIFVEDSCSGVKSATIDGNAITLTDDKYSFNASNYSDGNHTLVVTDNVGRVTTINFVSDKTAPTISGVTNGSRYNSDLTLSISDSLSNIKEFYLNDTLVSVSSGKIYSLVLNGDNLVQGTNTISGLKDVLGNVISSSVSFIYDTISPEINGVTEIESGEYLTTDKVKSQFSATDNVDGSVAVKVVSSDIVDKVGTYTVVLSATDKTGNTKEISVSVIRLDVVAPVIFIQSSDELKIIRISDGTELTYENLLNIFMFLYADDLSEDSVVECLSDSLTANGTQKCAVRYMVTNRATGDVNLYKVDFESYIISQDLTDTDEPTNPIDPTEPTQPTEPSEDVTNGDDEEESNWFVRMFKAVGNFFKKIWNTIKSWFSSDDETKDSSNVEIVETSKSNKEEVESDNAKFVLE